MKTISLLPPARCSENRERFEKINEALKRVNKIIKETEMLFNEDEEGGEK